MNTPLIQLGDFTLNSGKRSGFKLVADDFIRDNLDGLAHLIRKLVCPYSSVEGVPMGGNLLATALADYCQEGVNRHLIVDDVLTAGESMERVKARHGGQGPAGRPGVVGAVVFARGPCPPWVKAVFQLHEVLWLPRDKS